MKCAYCEASTASVSYGDVEHYRPKSRYWWLAYCLDNLLASCTLCNQRFKRASFPCDGERMAAPQVARNSTDARLEALASELVPDPLNSVAVAKFEALHREEKPLLVNPYFDDPARRFAWRADELLEEVELVPRDSDSEEYVAAAEELYGLNRLELKRDRFRWFRHLQTYILTLADDRIRPETRALVEAGIAKMQQSDQPFAGMIRFFLEAEPTAS